ncbi:RNAPII degradation factor [Elasticomyces elasticus]|uniref:RNA polymerase II degradation factor 1 n=1 Tax=Exophiala sideris TaxID=1016849 RepID=A0ABR0IYZ6_9EURO|nr:RNAPII degradation factor [Elasticomyces elasticus]KAK5021983.1 RNAPII degradation factor [Exophiala sideris]KAK5026046.1 RNAPII degradation factor [Exophiala sideris]KAK5050733.1 RNAPII degradation factor [Exophiala sideris]KAK5177218.1 RNAPII degradation factor [Eurotiomycetes sp. CCFEE 6388]
MAEVQPRGSGTRGRGGFRGGRGGFRGGRHPSRSQHKADNEQENIPPTSLEEQGEVGELKKKFGDKVPLLKEICPGWSDEDLVYALNETDGDVNEAVDRISSGTISQWGEVKKKQPKPKEVTAASTEGGSRGRGRGGFEGRGRGRGAERGARGGRGSSKSVANGTKDTKATDGWDTTAAALATEAVGGWDAAPTNGESTTAGDWANEPGKDSLASLQTEEPKPASDSAPAAAKPGGWAGLFAKPPPAPQKTAAPPPRAAQPEGNTAEPEPASDEQMPTEPTLPPPIEAAPSEGGPSELPSAPHSDTGKELAPARDELTEQNLEKLPDTSHPPQSATAVSTVASTQDPLAANESAKPALRPGLSGYAATALKATAGASRSSSYARKVMEQQEAVVMPGNHAIEKAAVQFGKLGLSGPDDIDVDEDREEPETRTQLPDDSPVAPRASLPPSLTESQDVTPSLSAHAPAEPMAQRQAPGLPPAPQQAQQPSPQSSSAYADQYRYAQQTQKPYDPFGQPSQTAQAQAQPQEPFSNQVPGQPGSTPSQSDYASYYGRDAYNYYGGYGQGQDAQRTGSTFGTTAPETQSQYATSRPQQGMGQEAPGSGHNTPAPGIPTHPSQHAGHLQNQGHAAYPGYGYPNAYNQQYPQYSQSYINQMNHRYGANRPMFDDARRQDQAGAGAGGADYYGSQYSYGQNHYGGGYKSNMYGQPQQGYSYDHGSSPAAPSTYARETAYGRSGSTQPSDAQQSAAGSTAFGGVADPFGRTTSGYGQTQQHGAHTGSDDPSKASGPSPSMQGGRPGSTVNSQQGGLPPPSQHSAQQQAFGNYPQYGAGFGNHQSGHQNTGYGSYGSNTGFGAYGGYGGGRGWNGSYGSGH